MPANLLVIVSGSIAAYKACEVISRLVQLGHRVRTVATSSALQFIGPATLEGLTGAPVATELFAAGAALDHIELARWANLILVCPATANTLNRAATGLADDLPGALLLAREANQPLLFAPAMNPAMWAHPATVASVARLRHWGAQFIPVGEGRTACGETGAGRLAEPDAIVAAVTAALTPPGRRLRVLITSGGTAEPIDGVRVLTNLSTGRTGAMIAEHLAKAGHEVVLARARHATPAQGRVCEETFSSFADLDRLLTRLLAANNFDAIIHAAAVSDFSVELVPETGADATVAPGKLDSHTARLLRLRPNPKLIDTLRERSRRRDIQIVAFKLTDHATPAAAQAEVRELLARAAPDVVVHNDLAEQTDTNFPATIHGRDGTSTACATRPDLAAALERLLSSQS